MTSFERLRRSTAYLPIILASVGLSACIEEEGKQRAPTQEEISDCILRENQPETFEKKAKLLNVDPDELCPL